MYFRFLEKFFLLLTRISVRLLEAIQLFLHVTLSHSTSCVHFEFDSNISFKIRDLYPVSLNLRDMKYSGIEYEGQYAFECW